ncbi:MAG: hypothetical protein ACSHYA_07815 [Opitutaceae bacterium]
MSLINQALRKAQQDRTPKRMAPPGGQPESGSIPAQPAPNSGMKPGIIIGLIVVVALLIGVIAGLSVVVFKDAPSAPEQAKEPTTPIVASETIRQPEATPAPLTPPAPSPKVAQPTTHTDPTPPVIDELRIAREAAEAKAAEQARLAKEAEAARIAAEAEKARIAEAKPSQDIITWLSTAKISGVRLSENDSKVILNGKAYSAGESVHLSFGLKVFIIQEKRVLFIDSNGKKYMKRI